MVTLTNKAPSRAPTTGYSISLIVALVGLTLTVVSLFGILYARNGRDPLDAYGLPGEIAFACSFGLLFLTRLIFSDNRSPSFQGVVRTIISVVLMIEVVAALVAAALIFNGPHAASSFLYYFIVIALLCQISSVLWLVSYRTE